jgi:hypothetical protein
MQIVMRPPCQCKACLAGRKMLSQAELARHFGIDVRLMREYIKAGLPGYRPPSRRWPRYSVTAAELWMDTRTEQGAA